MPGGKIVVLTGLTRGLNLNDDEIAAILGHEISHALREHSREKQARAAGVGILQQVAGIAIGALVKNPDAATIAQKSLPIASHLGLTLPHSRGNESEADKMGLELMARAGFNPYGAISFWQKSLRQGDGNQLSFFSTHPSDSQRIKDLEAVIPKVMPLYQQAKVYQANQFRTFR